MDNKETNKLFKTPKELLNELNDDIVSDNSINDKGIIENEPINYKSEEELIYNKYKLSTFEKVLISIKLSNPLFNSSDIHTELHNNYKTSNQYSEEYIKQTMCRNKVKGALKELKNLYVTETHMDKFNTTRNLLDEEVIKRIKDMDNAQIIKLYTHITSSDIKKVSESTITKVTEKPKLPVD